MPTKYSQFEGLNGQLSLDRLNINQRTYFCLPIQHFKADFLWKVSLKILNLGIILKTFTHVLQIFKSDISSAESCVFIP